MYKLFEYSIHYECYIKISLIWLSINSIYISYFTISILWDIKLSSPIKNHVQSFLNNINLSKDLLSFSNGLYNAIKIAFRFFLRCFCGRAGHEIFHLNICSMFLLMCSIGSDMLSGLLCSDQRVAVFRAVSSL